MTFPTWRTSGEVAPVDGDQKMPSSVSGCWHRSVEVAAGADQEMAQAAEVAAGAPSVEVAADVNPADNQDPEADGWLNTVQHLLTQRHRQCQSDSGRNKMSRLRRRELHKVGAKTKAAYVDVERLAEEAEREKWGRRQTDRHTSQGSENTLHFVLHLPQNASAKATATAATAAAGATRILQ